MEAKTFHITCKTAAAAEYLKKTLHKLRHEHGWLKDIEIDFIEPTEDWFKRTEGEILC